MIFDYLRSEVYLLKFSAWFVWDLCRVQRSRGKDARWPMELSMRMAPCPTTGGRSSGSWQTSPSGSWQAQTWWSSQCWQKWPNE